jgi:NarL family two-component system response regulator LiaR
MPGTILLVGDHGAMRQALRGCLEITFPNCCVCEAASGEEAIAMARAGSPHVIVVDIGLPGTNGLETTVRLKATVPTTPVVVLTSYEAEADSVRAMASGASACVSINRLAELESILAGLLSP